MSFPRRRHQVEEWRIPPLRVFYSFEVFRVSFQNDVMRRRGTKRTRSVAEVFGSLHSGALVADLSRWV